MLPNGRRLALAMTVDDEVDLVAEMVGLLGELLDRVVLIEGRTTFHGEPREVMGEAWAEVLDLPAGVLRTGVIDLPGREATETTMRQREMLQRATLALGVRDLADDDLVLAVDTDEFVDPQWLANHAAHITEPTRLMLLPLYGGLDRRAPDWHCCRGHLTLQPGVWPTPETTFLFPAGVIGPASALAGRGTHHWRATATQRSNTAGWHLLHVLPPGGDPARKHSRQAHTWDVRADTAHMRRALSAGVHPYGWWTASQIDVPDALADVARRHPSSVQGELPPDSERQALLRQWFNEFGEMIMD